MSSVDLNSILQQLELDPAERGLEVIDARELSADSFPRLDTDRPALVLNLAPNLLEHVTHTLGVNYPDAHSVTLINGKRKKSVTLDALANETVTRNTVLYVPPLPYNSSPLTLANIMARLREPVGGCPWDKEQTHESITRALVEETYEVIEAISDKDMEHLKEELGDLFLHVLFQTQIARDEGDFRLSDVGAELAAKLIRRHPHVFGDVQAKDAAAVLANWEQIKKQEKQDKGQTIPVETLEAGIPRELPALTRAQKVQERARRKKLQRTNGARPEIVMELQKKVSRSRDRERVLGELLLELAGIAEQQGIDAERALKAATKDFAQKK